MTISSLAYRRHSKASLPLLVIGDRISPRSAAAYRAADIQFIDALGNAFITFGSVLIEIQGRTESPHAGRKNISEPPRAQRSNNLFSAGRAQLVLALLTWPELARGGIRRLARAAGVSLGTAQAAVTDLGHTGLITRSPENIVPDERLLEYWAAAYPAGLGRRGSLAEYHGDPGQRLRSDQPIFLSGESAEGAGIVRPATLTAYVSALDRKLPILNRWSASPDLVPNVFIRQKFWVSPRPAEEDPENREQNAPWPLVYADLLATGDPRLAEVAEKWRVRHARSRRS
ncbi:type IV toxin-antitoxin system AbiEi family antitoxin [Actinoplanes missouriensis]|uniref:type IV toxin-antitoxin system AbiEi family antitoxin n=1 Tax=Actinoplanes missouriensis TaxID=1866 RepID=UPI0033F00E7F